jgi:hypothetical protein
MAASGGPGWIPGLPVAFFQKFTPASSKIGGAMNRAYGPWVFFLPQTQAVGLGWDDGAPLALEFAASLAPGRFTPATETRRRGPRDFSGWCNGPPSALGFAASLAPGRFTPATRTRRRDPGMFRAGVTAGLWRLGILLLGGCGSNLQEACVELAPGKTQRLQSGPLGVGFLGCGYLSSHVVVTPALGQGLRYRVAAV